MHQSLPSFSTQILSQTTLVDHIVEIVLMRPEGFHWQVGDYLWLGSEYTDFKPFSIANLPNESIIKLHIALVPNLAAWFNQLSIQAQQQIKGAVSQYHWVNNKQPIMMFAGGTGITPLLALLEGHTDALTEQSVTLYWGVRHAQWLFAHTELDALAQNYPYFSWQAVVSEPDSEWSGLTGLLPDVIAQQQLDFSNKNIMICGPWPMVQSIKNNAMALGVLAADAIQ
jgi:CDP-4-dehydro-6-deoxyglucose reductase